MALIQFYCYDKFKRRHVIKECNQEEFSFGRIMALEHAQEQDLGDVYYMHPSLDEVKLCYFNNSLEDY